MKLHVQVLGTFSKLRKKAIGFLTSVCQHGISQLSLVMQFISCEKPKGKGKGKSAPLQAWTGPEGSTKLRFPDYMTTAQDCVKVVSLTHRPTLPHSKYSWYSFLLEAELTPGP